MTKMDATITMTPTRPLQITVAATATTGKSRAKVLAGVVGPKRKGLMMNRRSFIKTVFGGLVGVFLCPPMAESVPGKEIAEWTTEYTDPYPYGLIDMTFEAVCLNDDKIVELEVVD